MPNAGDLHELQHDDYLATITTTGATLTRLQWRGRDLVAPAPTVPAADYRGAILAPWPNRIARGRYRWHETDYEVPANEVARGHALHGLVFAATWECAESTADAATFATRIASPPGYPFTVDLTVRWSLGVDGLTCTLDAHNAGATDAPYACGAHPYLLPAQGSVDEAILSLPAATQMDHDDRLVPTHLRPVPAAHDFRHPRRIAGARIDHTYTDLAFDTTNRVAVTVTDTHGAGARITFSNATPWVQIYTGTEDGGLAAGVAVEPMTAPPDAFNRGDDVVALAPGARHRTLWRIDAVGV